MRDYYDCDQYGYCAGAGAGADGSSTVLEMGPRNEVWVYSGRLQQVVVCYSGGRAYQWAGQVE